MRIGRLDIFRYGITWYGRPYTSRAGYKCRYWHTFYFRPTPFKKRFGYWQMWYDGPFHFFTIGQITLGWSHRPEPVDHHII